MTARTDDVNASRIVYITSLHSDDPGEEFFEPEIRALRALTEVLEVPVRPKSRRQPDGSLVEGLISWPVIKGAARTVARSPTRSMAAVLQTLDWRRPGKSLRNLLCSPKGLWLARELRDNDIMFAAWITTPATVAMIASTISGVPWATSIHRRDILEATPIRSKARAASAIRSISNASTQQFIERAGDVATPTIIHLGVDVPEEPACRRPGDGIDLLCPASLIPLKNHATLLKALDLDTTGATRLTCVGVGSERDALLQLAAELGVTDRVRMEGYVDHDELLSRMSAGEWDVVTLASFTEGIPVSLMEGLARGLPVVASDVGGVAELLDPAGGTLVQDPTDARAFLEGWRFAATRWGGGNRADAQLFMRQDFSAAAAAQRICTLLQIDWSAPS